MKRDPNIDLIRCTAFFFVVLFHSFLFNGFYFEEQRGVLMWAYNSVRWLSYSCNGIFMMLTGYLMTAKPWDGRFYRSLPSVILSYIIASAISIPFRHFVLNDVQSFTAWLARFMSFGGVYYGWYVKMYIGLLMLAPVFNSAMDALDKSGCRKILLTLLTLTALPSLTDLTLLPDYWVCIYPLTYYVIGAYIRRFGINIGRKYLIMCIIIVPMVLGLVTLISTDGYVTDGYGQDYGGIWITLIAVSVFLLLKGVKVPERLERPLSRMAGGTFEGYLISHLFDGKLYFMMPQWRMPEMWHMGFICLTVPIYFASIACGKAVNRVVNICLRRNL